jgi:hypothetical protein
MTWEELEAALLDLMGLRVTVDVFLARTPIPLAGLEGVLIDAKTTTVEGSDDAIAIALRIRPPDSNDTSFFHLLRPRFKQAQWRDWKDERGLLIRLEDLDVMVAPTRAN